MDRKQFKFTPISQHSVTVFTNESSYFESNITYPEREPDGHCLILQNLTVNETLYFTLELTNICDKGINYPGVNATLIIH